MEQLVPPSKQALTEALSLSSEILQNIEKSELPLTNIALKASRLARLLNDADYERIMQFEVSGYPSTPTGIEPETWRLVVLAGRKWEVQDKDSGQTKMYAYTEPIAQFEQTINLAPTALDSAHDANVSISSANPYQTIYPPANNAIERMNIRQNYEIALKRLSTSRTLIYQYILLKHYELKFSGISDDIFSRIRSRVDVALGQTIPNSVHKFSSAYNNLLSQNPEDWSNAVHSCRRILQELADSLFPPCEDKVIQQGKKTQIIKLGKDNYINRLIAFIEGKSSSDRFTSVVGSQLNFIGNRLDSIFEAAQKGSHTTITTKEEADRYVVYTYLIIGDILSLL